MSREPWSKSLLGSPREGRRRECDLAPPHVCWARLGIPVQAALLAWNIVPAVDPQEAFSIEQIRQLLKDLDVNSTLTVYEDPEGSGHSNAFECEQGDVNFICFLGNGDAVNGHLGLFSSMSVADDPFEYVNSLNSELLQSAAYVSVDESGELVRDDDGDVTVILRKFVLFGGGVTLDHLRMLLSYWMEDLYEFFGLDGSDESVGTDDTVADGSVRELGLAEQIEWLLGLDGIPRTARQVASFLMRPKHEVNSELYRNTGTFRRDDSQPPRWTVEQN